MRNKYLIVLPFLFLLTVISMTLPGQDTTVAGISNAPPEPDSSTSIILPLSRWEFLLSIIVLVFGLIIISFEIYLIRSRKISSEDAIKFVTITLIITSTLFLITAGYSNDQIAPAVGLLGTIAGYLLGRMQHPFQTEDKNEKPA